MSNIFNRFTSAKSFSIFFQNKKRLINLLLFFSFLTLLLAFSGLITERIKEKTSENEVKRLTKKNYTPKEFEMLALKSINIEPLYLRTRWKDGRMYYKFMVYADAIYHSSDSSRTEIKTYPTQLQIDKFQESIKKIRSFGIVFLDDAGFKIHELQVQTSQMTQIVDDNNRIVGLGINTYSEIELLDYDGFTTWECNYYSY